MEARQPPCRPCDILEPHVSPRSLVASFGARVRPKRQREGHQAGICHPLQRKPETLARDRTVKIPKILVAACQLRSNVYTGVQHKSLSGKHTLCMVSLFFLSLL